jgi:hypothetical protein
MYKLKGGHKVHERQLFMRTFSVLNADEPRTAKYFADKGKVYYIDAETGAAVKCNFNAPFLNSAYAHTFQPLDEFYEGVVDTDETEDEADETAE